MKPTLRSCGRLTTLLLAACFILAFISPGSARTWRVPSECATIKAGLDSSSSGDTVLAAPGPYAITYETAIVMIPGVILTSEEGPDSTLIEFCGPGSGIAMSQTEGARVAGFSIRRDPDCGSPHGLPMV